MSRAPAGAQDQGEYVNQRSSCVPAGTRKIYYACPGGCASLHHRLHSAAPTGARNNFTEFASRIIKGARPSRLSAWVKFLLYKKYGASSSLAPCGNRRARAKGSRDSALNSAPAI